MAAITEERRIRRRPEPVQFANPTLIQLTSSSLNNPTNRLSSASAHKNGFNVNDFFHSSTLSPQYQRPTTKKLYIQATIPAVIRSDATRPASFASGISSSKQNANMHQHAQPTFHTNMNQYSQINSSHANRPNPTQQAHQNIPPMNAAGNHFARRTLSNATSSTASSTGGQSSIQRHSGIHRSGSARSLTGSSPSSPTSYVALLRKQKATVWCDRAQYEDPRLLAQQRAEKMRATVEVVGGVHHGIGSGGSIGHYGGAGLRVSSGSSTLGGVVVSGSGVRSKIRHGSGKTFSTYGSGNLSASVVPPRLSATEVDEVDAGVNATSLSHGSMTGSMSHQRSGSSRSSLSGRRRTSGYAPSNLHMTQQQQPQSPSQLHSHQYQQNVSQYSNSTANTSQSDSFYDPEETPVPNNGGKDYFGDSLTSTDASNNTNITNGNSNYSGNNSQSHGVVPNGSGSRNVASSVTDHNYEQSFGRLSQMPIRTTQAHAPQGASQPQSQLQVQGEQESDLRRRGSVDERTSTMSGAVRLFIANPDLSD